ncbi:MAG: DUF1653 domain-containing protein [Bacteroidetes bacterium]|nr:DUF1653 domain-containing protein [Bacteroidota bacterium]
MQKPEKGFYYHYKHDPAKDLFNYAYEVFDYGMHTELHDDPNGEMVIYRPLYEAFVYKKGKWFDLRPIPMFVEEVIKDGKTFPRVQKITDPEIIKKLEEKKREMYS